MASANSQNLPVHANAELRVSYSASRGFSDWLAGTGGSIALTTYQAGRLLILGTDPDGALTVFERSFARPMGLALREDGSGFAMATQFELLAFNAVGVAQSANPDGFDAIFAPHVAWITGSVDAHDVGWGEHGRPIFVSTLYSCIAEVSDRHNFRPVWRPPFVSALAPEDRCHLNGMAVEGGRPKFATAIAASDIGEGWRDQRADGGVLIDVATSETIVAGLSMPHSPRIRDGRLWLLNSGAGQFGSVDIATGRFDAVVPCRGYARGLGFVGRHAVIGLSKPRGSEGFEGLPLQSALDAEGAAPMCGLIVVDLDRGAIVEWLRIEGAITELFDVLPIPGARSPSLIGFRTDEIKQRIAIGPAAERST